MRRTRRQFALGLCVAIAACTAGCVSSAHVQHGAPHEVAITDGFGEPSSLNPELTGAWPTSVITSELALAFFSRENRSGDLIPDLLTRIPSRENGDISPDGKSLTFHLRPNVRWSDGAPFSARDVEFTVKAILDPRNNVATEGFDLISKVRVVNPLTVIFELKKPFADFATTYFSTDGVSCILPAHAFQSTLIERAPFNEKPIGTGPFRVREWDRGTKIVFERNPYYGGSPPNLDRVTYLITDSIDTAQLQFVTHQAQIWDRIPESKIARARAVLGSQVRAVSPDAYLHVDLNVRRVTNPSLRRAILLALDRRAIVEKAAQSGGHLQEGVVNETNAVAPRLKFVERDVMQARRLLNGRGITFLLVYPAGDTMLNSVVELVRQELAEAGITLEGKAVPSTVFYAPGGVLYGGAWDGALFNWTLDNTGDLEQLYACDEAAPRGNNVGRYCDAQLDRLMSRYRATYGLNEKRAILKREEQIIDADVPTIVLFMRAFGYAADASVKGFVPHRDSPFDEFERVDVR